MTSIDKLIYDTLAARRGLFLAGIGSLEVQRRGARKLSETQIAPPQTVVVFNHDEVQGAVSVVSLISAAAGVDEAGAVAMYGSWLEGARTGEGLVIEGVGELREGGFVTAEPLHTALNPTNEEIVIMETAKKSTFPLWGWILIALAALALVLGAIWCCKKGGFCGRGKTPAVETVVVAPAAPSADSLAAAAAAAFAASPVVSGPRFHVIAGAFAIESNADKYMARLKRKHPELTPEKIVNPSNGYNMVSIFQMPTEREARRKMNLYWDIDLYLWIYQER